MVGHTLKRWSSTAATTTTFTAKATPSKAHLHRPIPSSAFPRGYLLSGTHAGVKKSPGAVDLALLLSSSPRPTSAAAVFTANAFRAAPVTISESILAQTRGRARVLVANSGCANAVTGTQGLADAWAMSRGAHALLPDGSSDAANPGALVMSTGVIGQPLPIARILDGIAAARGVLGAGFEHWDAAARAFMTTDTFPKLRARTFQLAGREFRLAGISKGAGMIHPRLVPPGPPHATLLAAFATDAAVSPNALRAALAHASACSFNSISIDGDMSTNDTVVLFANGAAAPADVPEIEEGDAEFAPFCEALTDVMQELAQLVVRDGEGATKFVTIGVEGALTYEDAHAIASRISTSALVKTALYGEDANWGRILAATGSVPLSAPLDPSRVSVSLIPRDGTASLPLLTRGEPENVDEVRAKQILVEEDVDIRVELGLGKESAKFWTCDFSYEYVRINGDYRS